MLVSPANVYSIISSIWPRKKSGAFMTYRWIVTHDSNQRLPTAFVARVSIHLYVKNVPLFYADLKWSCYKNTGVRQWLKHTDTCGRSMEMDASGRSRYHPEERFRTNVMSIRIGSSMKHFALIIDPNPIISALPQHASFLVNLLTVTMLSLILSCFSILHAKQHTRRRSHVAGKLHFFSYFYIMLNNDSLWQSLKLS